MKSTELMDSKYCVYSKDSYTDEERKSLCDGCEEDCEYNQKKEPDELTHSVRNGR